MAKSEKAVLVTPHVPSIAIKPVGLDIGDDHAHFLTGLAFKSDTGLLANDAMAAVTADQPARGDRLGLAVLDERRRDPLVRLLKAGERRCELDGAAELFQPQPQRFLDPPLGRDQACRIRDVGAVLQRLGHTAAQRHRAIGSGRTDRHGHPAVGDHAITHAEVVEYFQSAWLDALAA